MKILQQLESENRKYSLHELVEIANRLLPRFLPEDRASFKLNEEVNPRLVRQLSTLGLLDEALREGREARYLFRHLLQLLVARRLMAQGYTTGAVKKLIAGAENEQLKSLLEGGAQLTVASSHVASRNPEHAQDAEPISALSFLQNIRARGTASAQDSATAPTIDGLFRQIHAQAHLPSVVTPRYVRVVVRPGLEIHVGEEFELPPSAQERESLLQEILGHLKTSWHHGAGRKRRTR